jgi:hypothetical protein
MGENPTSGSDIDQQLGSHDDLERVVEGGAEGSGSTQLVAVDSVGEHERPIQGAELEIPPQILTLPRDKRGYPIPYIAILNADGQGTPDFRTIDEEHWNECAIERLCEVCGRKLGYWIVFIGGKIAVDNRRFLDPPMHRECAEYARAVCPYLVTPGYIYSRKTAPEGYVNLPFVKAERPDQMFMYVTRSYDIVAEELERTNPLYPRKEVYLFRPAPAKELIPFP